MRFQGEELVKVRSESELRAGLCVVHDSATYGRRMTLILVRQRLAFPCFLTGEVCEAWISIGKPDPERPTCFHASIPEGRLYRLRDEDTPSAETTEKQREAVR